MAVLRVVAAAAVVLVKDFIYLREPSITSLALLLREARSKPGAYKLLHTDEALTTWRGVQRRVAVLLGGPVVAQRIPTVRWFDAHETVPYEWHTDCDEGFGHPAPLYNLWVAVTPLAQGVLTTDGETSRAMLAGDALLFEGSKPHRVRTVEYRRFTFDGRFIPRHLYFDTDHKSDIAGVPIRLGDYYEEVAP